MNKTCETRIFKFYKGDEMKSQNQRSQNRTQNRLSKVAAAVAIAIPLLSISAFAEVSVDQEGKPLGSTGSVGLYSNSDTALRMYGIVEATLSQANNQVVQGQGQNVAGFQTSYFSGNRLGFDAIHLLPDLGAKWGMPDLQVMAKMESEFELPTGNMDTANVLFNRDAWMGFYAKSLGKLTFGRQNTLTRDFTNNWGDPFGAAATTLKEGGYSNVNNFKQLIFYSGGPNSTRYNSAIEWKKEIDSHIIAGLGYKFNSNGAGGSGDVGNGGGVPGDFADGNAQAASIAYNNLDLGGGSKMNLNASLDDARINKLNHQSTLIGGNIVFNPTIRWNLGFIHYTAQQGVNNAAGTRTDDSWTTSFKITPDMYWEYDIGYQVMKGKNAGFGGSGTTLNPFGNTAGVTTTATGEKDSLYAAVFYHADKNLDLYVAADTFTMKGGWVVGDAMGNGNHYGLGQVFNGTTEVAVGGRFKF